MSDKYTKRSSYIYKLWKSLADSNNDSVLYNRQVFPVHSRTNRAVSIKFPVKRCSTMGLQYCETSKSVKQTLPENNGLLSIVAAILVSMKQQFQDNYFSNAFDSSKISYNLKTLPEYNFGRFSIQGNVNNFIDRKLNGLYFSVWRLFLFEKGCIKVKTIVCACGNWLVKDVFVVSRTKILVGNCCLFLLIVNF